MNRTKRKAFGQHFLTNLSILDKIVRAINPQKDELILEIGAGRGALTFPLARRSARVIAVEKDRMLIPFLKAAAPPNVEVVEADILDVDIAALVQKEPLFRGNLKVAGNLPYSISTPLLFKVLEARDAIGECFFLIQKEVAERICARPGTKKYAPLSVAFQLFFEAKILFHAGPQSFSPPPKVFSSLISLKKRAVPLHPISGETSFLEFLHAAFKQRRKFLRKNLERRGFAPQAVEGAFARLGLDPKARAEQLTIEQFVALRRALMPGPANML